MRWVITSDIHSRGASETRQGMTDGLPTVLHDVVRLFAAMRREGVEEHGAEKVVILGDLWHERRQLGVEVLVRTIQAVQGLGVPTTILAGNHDLAVDAVDARLSALSAIPDVEVALESQEWWVGDVLVRVVPYQRDEGAMADAMAAPDCAFGGGDERPAKGTRRLLLTHAMFQGAQRGPWDYFGDSSGVPREAVAQYDLVLSGHVHRSQVLGQVGGSNPISWGFRARNGRFYPQVRGTILYTGSPYALQANQANDALGWWTLDFPSLSVRQHPFDGPVYRQISSAVELEHVLEEVDPVRLNVRAVLVDARDLARVREMGRVCRSFSVTMPHEEPLTPERAAVVRAVGDEDMLAAFLQRYVAEAGQIRLPSGERETLEAVRAVGLKLLRGEDDAVA